MPRLNLIAAVARNGVIGRNQQIPWQIPGEQAYFKKVTLGHPIVMGRKTWESLGRALPGRRNIVVSRNSSYVAPGAEVVTNLASALRAVADVPKVFVIGGSQLYAEALPAADRLFLTEIDSDVDGDTFFPAFDRELWHESSREYHAPNGQRPFGYSFVVYERRVP